MGDDGKMIGTYYTGADLFFIGVNVIGLLSNVALYYVDIKYHGGVLDKVDAGDQLTALISSPKPGTKGEIIRESIRKGGDAAKLAQYKTDDDVRASLRRSLAAQRPYQ